MYQQSVTQIPIPLPYTQDSTPPKSHQSSQPQKRSKHTPHNSPPLSPFYPPFETPNSKTTVQAHHFYRLIHDTSIVYPAMQKRGLQNRRLGKLVPEATVPM